MNENEIKNKQIEEINKKIEDLNNKVNNMSAGGTLNVIVDDN